MDSPNKRSFMDRIIHAFQGEPQNRDELVEMFRDSEENHLIDHSTRDMLEGVIQISDMKVRDIMIPRSQITAIDKSMSLDEIIALIIQASHSRYPVISDDKDHIEGILLAKDLLQYLKINSKPFNINEILRPSVVVPESKKVDRLLKEFREKRYHMAIVVDEFGGVSGVITIEDILEEIVGEIEDEFDDVEDNEIKPLNKHTFNVKALLELDDFDSIFKTNFNRHEDIGTIGGLLMMKFGHLPESGETITIDNYQFKVTSSDSRRIIQVQVVIPKKSPLPHIDKDT